MGSDGIVSLIEVCIRQHQVDQLATRREQLPKIPPRGWVAKDSLVASGTHALTRCQQSRPRCSPPHITARLGHRTATSRPTPCRLDGLLGSSLAHRLRRRARPKPQQHPRPLLPLQHVQREAASLRYENQHQTPTRIQKTGAVRKRKVASRETRTKKIRRQNLSR